MVSVTLAMIVKNEEENLGNCLESITGCVDEIIVVDTGSTDRTKQIAESFGAKIFDFEWIDDFSAARNYSFEKATSDYILWLDADDILPEKSRDEFLKLKSTLDKEVDVVMMRYDIAFSEEGKPTFSFYRERLLKNNRGFVWSDPVHETITPFGKIIHSEIAVEHRKKNTRVVRGDRNLKIYRKMIESGKSLSPRQRFYFARELMDNGHFKEAKNAFSDFLTEGKGWKENNIEACKNLAFCCLREGELEKSLEALLSSFKYDTPRAEILCDIGGHYLRIGKPQEAAYWFELALTLKPQPERGGFCLLDCYGYLPCIQLCVCYDRLGDRQKAIEFNERAAVFQPQSRAIKYNREYFQKSKP